MPLVRFEVRNEYALGDPELYRAETKKDDPRAILDGVAVAGLVGILRQLGDLAEFAADIFHDLHEQVISTAARGKRMLTRIQNIESALSPIEKAVQGQRSYIHFAYIAGSDWYAKVRTGQNQLLCSDLPQYMIDFYEECCDPPRLYLLDKFDSSGAGACLKRYSDPSYFKRALAASEPMKAEKVKRKKKKRGSRLRNEGIQHPIFASRYTNSSTQFASTSTDQLSFSGENVSFSDTRSKSELARESIQIDSDNRANFVEQVSDMPHEREYDEFSDPASKSNHSTAVFSEPKQEIVDDDSQPESLQQLSAPSTSSVTWDEKTEIVKPIGANLDEAELVDSVQDLDSPPQIVETSKIFHETAKFGTDIQEDVVIELANARVSYDGVPSETDINTPVTCHDGNLTDDVSIVTDNFKDATIVFEPEIKAVSECQIKLELKSSNSTDGVLESKSCRLNETSVTNSACFDAQAPIAPCSSSNSFVLSDDFDHIQSAKTNCYSPKSDSSVGNGYFKSQIPNMPGLSISEPLDDELSSEMSVLNEQNVPVNDVNGDKILQSQDYLANTSDLPSVSFWTNGGILGLAPSKPPDFSVSANSEPAMCNGSPSKVLSETDRGKSDGESQEADVAAPVSDLTAIHSTGLQPSDSNKKIIGISTSFSGLANKFLSNNLQRKILVAHAGLSKPSQMVNADFRKLQEILLQNDHQELSTKAVPNALCEPEKEETIEEPLPSSLPSFGSSSPPLEYMKLSFHPMNSSDTSELKLEFSSGSPHEGSRDLVCPSFHLIPGSSSTIQESGSESDDDTFCRSSVYSSDDLLSLHSESNSELWGEDEKSESQKQRLSANSCRISSSTPSTCSSLKFEQMDSYNITSELEHLEIENGRISDSIRDLPLVNSITYNKMQQKICKPLPFDSLDSTSHSPNELPPPPPLPPLQWRLMKLSDNNHSVETIDSACMEAMMHVDPQAQSQQEQREPSSSCCAENPQMLHGNRRLNHNYDFNEYKGREDLLQQIRSKSFNLRRTIIKPSHT